MYAYQKIITSKIDFFLFKCARALYTYIAKDFLFTLCSMTFQWGTKHTTN